MAGLHGVVRADAQYGAGVSTRSISHYNHTWPVTVRDTAQVFLCELQEQQEENY